MNRLFTVLRQIFATAALRKKILFTIVMLLVFRILAHITIPGADGAQIATLMQNSGQGTALSVLALLTGGAMERFSVTLMGLTPYINASIVMQLLTVLVPQLENLKAEGEAGQKKINQYTRLLTVPLAFVQSYGMMVLLNNFSPSGAIIDTSFPAILPAMLTVTAGTVLLMWIGELISEKGIGNGISLLIFAGIVSTVPTQIGGAFQAASMPVILGLIIATLLLTIFVVYVSEGDRRVSVVYASKKSGAQAKSFLPLKVNMAGMIPIIFAVSLVSMPSIFAQFMLQSERESMVALGTYFLSNFNPANPTTVYNIVYGGLIVLFTFFYVSITFEPKKVAENIQKRGGFIPGYRPGKETEKFLAKTSDHLAFWGALFLAAVAIVPLLFERWISGGANSISLFISGAGIIIVVSVVLDLVRRINMHLVAQDYDKL